MTAETASTQYEEREVLILEGEVYAQSHWSAIPATLTKVNLVFAIDNTIVVLVLILKVTRLDSSTKGRLRNTLQQFAVSIEVGLSEEAEALITPDGIQSLTLTILISILISIVIALRSLCGVVSYVSTTLETELTEVHGG